VATAYNPPNDWARLIDDLVRRAGSIKAFAAASGINRNTIRRWRTGESTNVTRDYQLKVAKGGNIDNEEVSRAALGAERQRRADEDAAVAMIEASDAAAELKSELIAHVRNRRRESEDSILRDVELMLRASTAN
jgi:transcriptional regulator with XRE-family HTH domain